VFNYRLPDRAADLEYVGVAQVSELGDGQRLLVEIDGRPIVVFNVGGAYFAIGDECSHDDGPVGEGELEGFEIECPRHGARFDLRTGKVLCTPAVVDIPAYPVRVVGEEIQIGVPS
jgi:3-phenylpropionate/trans-cinnamate dioxygenase ferredoxin component